MDRWANLNLDGANVGDPDEFPWTPSARARLQQAREQERLRRRRGWTRNLLWAAVVVIAFVVLRQLGG